MFCIVEVLLIFLFGPPFYCNLIQCIVKLVCKLLMLLLVHSIHCFNHPFHGSSVRNKQEVDENKSRAKSCMQSHGKCLLMLAKKME